MLKFYSSYIKSWCPQISIDHLGSNVESVWNPDWFWVLYVSFGEYSNNVGFKPSCKSAARNSWTTLVIVGL